MTDNEKLIKLFNNIEKIKKLSDKTTEQIYQLTHTVYNIDGLIKLKFTKDYTHTIIEFDKDHYVKHTKGGVPKFFGPSSNKWDIATADMFNDFVDNTLDKIDIIGDIFIF